MSKVPFYADADEMTKPGSWREVCLFVMYITLSMASMIILMVGDNTESILIKALAVVWLIGLPLLIMWHGSRKIEAHADELLKTEYYKHAAGVGMASIFAVLIWALIGRWGGIFLNKPEVMGNSIITLTPYLIIFILYGSVRVRMKAIAKVTS